MAYVFTDALMPFQVHIENMQVSLAACLCLELGDALTVCVFYASFAALDRFLNACCWLDQFC